MASEARKLFLVDGMALIYRSHYALAKKPVFTATGINTSAIHGFLNSVLELLEQQKPTHFAVALDTPDRTKRHDLFPEYKAKRNKMPDDLSQAMPHLKRLLAALNVPVIEASGYEADDVVGTLAKQAEKAGFETFMVTMDKDFAQLVSEQTKWYRPGQAGYDADVLGVEEVRKEWDVQEPSQVADVLALAGDTVDNIPGVPGIGGKTARKLIGEYGTLEALLEKRAEVKGRPKKLLEEHSELSRTSKLLATITCDVPLTVGVEDCLVKEMDGDAMRELCTELELVGLGKRLFGRKFKAGKGAVKDADGSGHSLQDLETIDSVEHEYVTADTEELRAQLVAEILAQSSFCFDIETNSLTDKELVGISFSWGKGKAYYVPIPPAAEAGEVLDQLRPIFETEGVEKVGHNIKFDILGLLWAGIRAKGPFIDTMLTHSLVEPDHKHGMDILAETYLGYSPVPFSALMGDTPRRKQPVLRDVDQTLLAEYAAEDADVTWQLAEKLVPMLADSGQEKVFYEIEAPLLPVLADMEHTGIRLDETALATVREDLEKTLGGLEESIFKVAGRSFNINSPKQLGEVLFEELELMDRPRKTRSGQYHTSDKVLQLLAPKHAIVADIIAYRGASKLKSTYVDALPKSVHPETGRVHTTFKQLVTATGRLQSNDPNLQNIPVRTVQGKEIRKAFVPKDGWRMLSADYSQIELRVMAAISGDEAMAASFQAGEDIHTATAARVFDVALADVTEDMRRKAKTVNFGIIYGVSSFGLASNLGIHHSEAKEMIDEYFRRFPGVDQYMEKAVEDAREKGYVETIAGRRRYLRDINSSNMMLRTANARLAVNSPIQGSAADLIKVAMARIHNNLAERQLRANMLLQVHDELIFEMHPDDEEAVKEVVGHHMRTALDFGKVPIEVEMGVGNNWMEAH